MSASHSSHIVQSSGSGIGIWKYPDCEIFHYTYILSSRPPLPINEVFHLRMEIFQNYVKNHSNICTSQEDKNGKFALAP